MLGSCGRQSVWDKWEIFLALLVVRADRGTGVSTHKHFVKSFVAKYEKYWATGIRVLSA